MTRHWTAAVCGIALLAGTAGAQVQPRDTARSPRVLGRTASAAPSQPIGTPHYDVVLEVPELAVDSIGLTVADLQAYLALNANAANLVSLTAGADVRIQRVELELTGVRAEAYVYVDLDNVARIVDRVLATLGNNPEILTRLLSVVDTAVGAAGGAAGTLLRPDGAVSNAIGAVGGTLERAAGPGGLLSRTVNTAGRTLQTTLDATGRITEQTLDAAGNVVGSRALGSVTELPLVRETPGTAGGVIRTVRHSTGALLEYTTDAAGRVTGARVLQPAQGTQR